MNYNSTEQALQQKVKELHGLLKKQQAQYSQLYEDYTDYVVTSRTFVESSTLRHTALAGHPAVARLNELNRKAEQEHNLVMA